MLATELVRQLSVYNVLYVRVSSVLSLTLIISFNEGEPEIVCVRGFMRLASRSLHGFEQETITDRTRNSLNFCVYPLTELLMMTA